MVTFAGNAANTGEISTKKPRSGGGRIPRPDIRKVRVNGYVSAKCAAWLNGRAKTMHAAVSDALEKAYESRPPE